MRKILFISIAVLLSAQAGFSENWPMWRGADFNGVSEVNNIPVSWSNTENIAWKFPFPGGGGSTPVIWEDNIFVTTIGDGNNIVLCLDRKGQERWQTPVGKASRPQHRQKGSGAHPSPATDGEKVFVYFGSQDLACLDFKGKIIWQKNLVEMYGEDNHYFDISTSPVLTKDYVIVSRIQTGNSFLLAFDKETGEVAWKHDRNFNAPRESNQSYTTPVIVREGDAEKLYIIGADHITAHNAKDGNEIWRVSGLNPRGRANFRCISNPIVYDGLLVAPYARGSTLTAVRLGGSGDITDSHIAWKGEEVSADVPTAAVLDGKMYICTDRGTVACVEVKSGDVLWSGEVPEGGTFSSSVAIADGKIFVTNEQGKTYVLELTDEFKLLGGNELGEYTLSTPVFFDGHILIRTFENLYCIGN